MEKLTRFTEGCIQMPSLVRPQNPKALLSVINWGTQEVVQGVRAEAGKKKNKKKTGLRQDKRAILKSLLFNNEHSYYSEPQITDVIVKKTKE